MANRHLNARRPHGPECADCGAPFAPVCPTKRCPGRRVPLAIIREQHGRTQRHPEQRPAA